MRLPLLLACLALTSATPQAGPISPERPPANGTSLTIGRDVYLSTVRPVDHATIANAPMVLVSGRGSVSPITAPVKNIAALSTWHPVPLCSRDEWRQSAGSNPA